MKLKTPLHHYNPYGLLAPVYDSMASLFLLPFGGELSFRQSALEFLDLKPGMRLLELGCGTGSMSRLLANRGVEVVGIDLSRDMLAVAKNKNRGLDLRCCDILTFDGQGEFDRVLISFVLHEMTEEIIVGALKTAHRAIKDEGKIGVLDFSKPPGFVLKQSLNLFLKLAEPIEARRFINNGLEYYMRQADLHLADSKPLALGMAQMRIGTRA